MSQKDADKIASELYRNLKDRHHSLLFLQMVINAMYRTLQFEKRQAKRSGQPPEPTLPEKEDNQPIDRDPKET